MIYTITTSMPGYLLVKKTIVVIEVEQIVNLSIVTLLGGDANGDGKINSADLAQIALHFNTSNTASDINADGRVDILDLVVAGVNFNKDKSPWD